MRSPFSRLGLLGLLLVAPFAPLSEAVAQDDDRRVLRARHMDETASLSEEYRRRAEEKRLESIRFLEGLLSRGDATGDRKAEMMLRLADMYFKQGRDIFLSEMEAFDQEYDRCFNDEACNPDGLDADTSASNRWQERSIRLYQSILQHYPRYSRADEATYYLAAALNDLGREDEAKDQFLNLVRVYPNSQWVPDAQVNVGEYYFDRDNAYKALLAYQRAAAYEDHELYGFAMYKLAWCYYNVGEYNKSISTMQAVVDYSRSEADSGVQLGDEALRDLVRFFADAGQLDEAYEYFGRLGHRDLIRSLLRRLASTYFENGNWDEAIETYRRLIAEEPHHRRNFEYQAEIVKAYRQMGNQEQTFTEIDRMLQTYGSDSAWARANASDRHVIREAQDQIERDLLDIATHYHDRARRLHGDAAKASYALADRAYRIYLDEYPSSSHTYDMRYQFAELLFATERFDEAHDQYVAVVEMDPEGQHSKWCAENAIHSADEMIKREQAESTAPETDGPQPLTEWEEKLVEACDRYARHFADDEKVRSIIYRSAYLLYDRHQLEDAAERFRTVIEMDPQSDEAEKAAHLILDSFVLTDDWANLKRNARFFYEQERLGSARFKQEVFDIYQRASLRVIEVAFEEDQDHGTAADAYMAFYEDFPDSSDLPLVLNNAAIYYREAGRIADAMKVRRILVDDPQFGDETRYYYDQLAALGFEYETIADFDRAAHYYERLFALYPKHREDLARDGAEEERLATLDAQAADAIWSAALFRRAQESWSQATSNYKQFIDAFAEDPRVNDARFTIAEIFEEQEDWAQAASVYYTFYTQADDAVPLDDVYFARLQYAKALEQQGQEARAQRVYEETVALYEQHLADGGEPGAHTEIVAEMMYVLAEPIFESYAAKEITGCGCQSQSREDAALEATMVAKGRALVEVEEAYTEIVRTGAGEWGLAALVKLGQAYENMGEAFRTSDIPFYLTEGQREIYEMRLEDRVYPQRERAAAAYKTALEKSWELTLYNDDTALANRRLGVLAADDFPGMEEEAPLPHLTSRSTRTFDFETEL